MRKAYASRLLRSIAACCYLFLIFDCSALPIGIDVGNAFFKIATISSRRSFEIIPNFQSERKTHTAVCFSEETRVFGSQALQKSVKNPSDTVLLLPSLLSLNATDQNALSPRGPYLPLQWVIDKPRGVPLFVFPKRNISMTAEELLAHQFQYIHDIIEGPKRFKKIFAVLTIPQAFKMRHRQALYRAASLANITVSKFVYETPAASLYHTMDLSPGFKGKKLFINVGAWRVQACIVEYGRLTAQYNQTGSVKKTLPDVHVIWCQEQSGLGGYLFDRILAEHIVDVAEKKFNFTDLRSSSTTLQRVLRQAERAKIILSTNKAADVYLENLQGERTLRTTILRTTFEELIEPLVNQSVQVVHRALSISNHTMANISGVEVIGGGWRVPLLHRRLTTLIHPHNLGQHLNGDEAMAFGASLVAANTSTAIRLRPIIYTYEPALTYVVKAYAVSNQQNYTHKILPAMSRETPEFRSLNIVTCDDILGELWEKDKEGSMTLLETYNITGVKSKCQKEYKTFGESKVSLIFKMNPLGWVTLERALAYWEEKYTTIVRKTPTTTTTTTSTILLSSSNNTTTTQEEPTEPETTRVEKTRRHSLKCNVTVTALPPGPLTKQELSHARASVAKFMRIDDLSAALAQIQNTIEAYAYKSRAFLNEEFIYDFVDESTHKNVSSHLEETLNWIYGSEAKTASSTDIYEQKLKDLQNQIDPIVLRYSEYEKRNTVKDEVHTIEARINETLSMNKKLDANATAELTRRWDKFQTWYEDVVDQQSKKALRDVPAYTTDTVKEYLKNITDQIRTVQKTAKTIVESVTIAPDATTTTTPLSSNSTDLPKNQTLPSHDDLLSSANSTRGNNTAPEVHDEL